MATTYTLINSNTLGSNAASVTFSSIPSTYTDLVLRASIRSAGAGADGGLVIFNNDDASTNYSLTWIRGTGATASTSRLSSRATGNFTFNLVDNSNNLANTYSLLHLYIPNYTASTNKPWCAFLATENNSASTDINLETNAGLWRITTAISTITIKMSSQNLASGSSFYLYGIKNS